MKTKHHQARIQLSLGCFKAGYMLDMSDMYSPIILHVLAQVWTWIWQSSNFMLMQQRCHKRELAFYKSFWWRKSFDSSHQ